MTRRQQADALRPRGPSAESNVTQTRRTNQRRGGRSHRPVFGKQAEQTWQPPESKFQFQNKFKKKLFFSWGISLPRRQRHQCDLRRGGRTASSPPCWGEGLFLPASNGSRPNVRMFLIKGQYLWMLARQRGKSAISAGPPPARTGPANIRRPMND